MFDETTRVGGFTLDKRNNLEAQIDTLRTLLVRKLGESRMGPQEDGVADASE